MPDPGTIREAISKAQNQSTDAERPRSSRSERCARLLLAAAVALIVLVAVVWGGIYYFVEYANFSDPFSEGLGLKNTALISFGVSSSSWPSRRAAGF